MTKVTKSYNSPDSSFLLKKIQNLEIQLAEKSDLLEKTAQTLAESQRKYQELLIEFETIKSRYSSNNYQSIFSPHQAARNESLSFSSLNDKSGVIDQPEVTYTKSLNRIRNTEIDLSQLSLDNLKQRKNIENLISEQNEWNNFAVSTFSQIHDIVSYDKSFPENDSEAQRFILSDLIRKLVKKSETAKQTEELSRKYKMSQIKLRQIQLKCDKMLQLLGEKGYDISCFTENQQFRKRRNTKRKMMSMKQYDISSDEHSDFHLQNVSVSTDNDNELNEFKKDVQTLIGVTHNMKDHYKQFKKISPK